MESESMSSLNSSPPLPCLSLPQPFRMGAGSSATAYPLRNSHGSKFLAQPMADEPDRMARARQPAADTHFPSLNVPPGGRVFVPLCGKSLDLGWLLSRGYAIAGAELSELAVTQLFAELGMEPSISDIGKLRLFHGEKIDIFVGDIFDLSARSSAPSTRCMTGPRWSHYRKPTAPVHGASQTITGMAPQLVIGYEYDQTVVSSSFSVTSTSSAAITGALALARDESPADKGSARKEYWRLAK